ncbi:MAG: DedA family protein [Parcubacteria group bacterium]|jgi:membrane protein DedA with SNARE-associated domain
MQHIFDLVASAFVALGIYKYAFLFVMALIEGPIIMTATGFLLHFGQFDLLGAYMALTLGDLAGDFCWYGLGYIAGKRMAIKFGKYFSLDEKTINRIEKIFHRHHEKIIFISKITMGFGFSLATLITAGVARVSLKKFGFYNLLGGFIWTGLIMGLGYALGSAYTVINEGFRVVFVVASIITIMAALYGIQRFIRAKFSNNNGL